MKVHNQGIRSSLVRHTHLIIICFVNFDIITSLKKVMSNLTAIILKNVTSVYVATSNVLFRQNKLTTVHT